MHLDSVLAFAHAMQARAVPAGGVAIDATVGNGHDTLFLAQMVGPEGTVYGFDVQAAALQQTRERLSEAQVAVQVVLAQAGHEVMNQHIPAHHHGQAHGIMFNLGYLPGSDKQIITRPQTTLPALNVALELLAPQGLLSVVVYPGHEGGAEESQAVYQWASLLAPDDFRVATYRFINRCGQPPWLLLVEKR